MRRLRSALLVGAVVVALGTAGTVLAYAGGWTVEGGQATLTAKVAKMPRGVEPSVAKQAKQAVVSWSAQEIVPNVRMDHYLVTAHSVSDPPLPDVTHTVAAGGGAVETVTFTAGEVAGGRWYWTVTPKYRLWTGEESGKSARLTFPAATKAEAEAAARSVSPLPTVDAVVAPSPAPREGAPSPVTPTEKEVTETTAPPTGPPPTSSSPTPSSPGPAETAGGDVTTSPAS